MAKRRRGASSTKLQKRAAQTVSPRGAVQAATKPAYKKAEKLPVKVPKKPAAKKPIVNQTVDQVKSVRSGAAAAKKVAATQKKIAKAQKDLSKQPRKKTRSDEIYNARRRAKRVRDRILKDIQAGKTTMQENRSFLENLESTIAATYAGKKGAESAKTAMEAARLLQQMAPANLKRSERLDKAFGFKLNQANKFGDVLGADGQIVAKQKTREALEIKAFYTATQELWQGKPLSERNKIIKSALGASTLEEAFTKVMSNEKVKAAVNGALVTEELKAIEAVYSSASAEEVASMLRQRLHGKIPQQELEELIAQRTQDYISAGERTTDDLDYDEPEPNHDGSPIEFLMLRGLF